MDHHQHHHKPMFRNNFTATSSSVMFGKYDKAGCDNSDKIQIESVDSSFKDEPVGSQPSQSEASSNEHLISKKSRAKRTKKRAKKKSRRREDSDMSDSDEDGSISSNSDESSAKKRKKSRKSRDTKQTKKRNHMSGSDSNNSISGSSSSRSSSVSDLLSDSSASQSANRSNSNSSRHNDSNSNVSNDDRADRSDDNQYSDSEKSDLEQPNRSKRHDDSFDKSIDDKIYRVRKKCNDYERLNEKLIKQLKLLKKKQKGKDSSKEKMRYEANKKKLLRKKKKIEHKLEIYQERMSLIKSSKKKQRQSKEHFKEKEMKYSLEDFDQKEDNQRGIYENVYQQNYPISSAGNIKIPYPVLNDSRDQKTILGILKNKQAHLNGMLEQTLTTLKNIENESESKNHEDSEARKNRLKNLEDNIKVQLTRLTRQIDFINYGIEVSKLSKLVEKLDDDDRDKARYSNKRKELNSKVEHLFNFMNDANQRFIKQQEGNNRTSQYADEGGSKRLKESGRDKPLVVKPDQHAENEAKQIKQQLNIDYYRSMPPPIAVNKKDTADKKAAKKPQANTFIPHQSRMSMAAPFNSQNYSNASVEGYTSPKNHVPAHKTQLPIPTNQTQTDQSSNTANKTITPDSDPKEILKMLNAKYGSKKAETTAPKVEEKPKATKQEPPTTTKSDYNKQQPNRKTNQTNLNDSRNTANNYPTNYAQSIETNLLSANLPVSLLNSPAFMSTMTSMLHSMSQQGVNINTIINQLPSILSSFTNSNNSPNQMNNYNSMNPNNIHRSHQYQYPPDESALLPNPSVNMSDPNVTESFASYLSNAFQNMPQEFGAGMSSAQLNAMMLESGFMEDFNAYYDNNYNYNNTNDYYNNTRSNFNNNYNTNRDDYFNNNNYNSSNLDYNHGHRFKNNNKFKRN